MADSARMDGADKGSGGIEQVDGAALPGHARDLALPPSMPVEVHVRTDERSPLSYLAKPLTDYFSRGPAAGTADGSCDRDLIKP